MRNKRGISPLIATVLLIVIVIVIALLIFFWYKNVIERQHEKQQLTTQLICAQKVEFTLDDVSCKLSTGTEPDSIIFSVTNTGSVNIDSFKVVVTGDAQLNKQTGTGVLYPQSTQLSIDVTDIVTQGSTINVEAIPIILNQGEAGECTEKSQITYSITCTQ